MFVFFRGLVYNFLFLLSLSVFNNSNATDILQLDPLIKPKVDFWIKIYSEYSTSQGVLHDGKNPLRIYQTLDWTHNHRDKNTLIKNARRHWREVLLSLHKRRGDYADLSADQKLVLGLFSDSSDPARFLQALDRKRMRLQVGQKDRFLEGYINSGRWLYQMESIFKSEGLPVELTRLPFVESSFNVHARSKVGASGIWQFMRSTGRMFLIVDDAVDERNDPIKATLAAAQLLKVNYDSLGQWPLAVTAYNHGRTGILRAVKKIGSNSLSEVIQDYRSRTFGFASSNFYSSLLAAIYVEREAEKYFGKVVRLQPEPVFAVPLPNRIKLKDLCQFLGLSKTQISSLNPSLLPPVYQNKIKIPKGYSLRLKLPEGKTEAEASKNFLVGFEEIPKRFKL